MELFLRFFRPTCTTLSNKIAKELSV